MTWRCLFSTSSYLRTFLRISAFCPSIWVCALWICAGDHLRLDRHVLGDVEPVHDRLDRAGAEPPHQVVLQRQVEARLARVALAAGAAAELVVDAARLVPLGAEDVEAAGLDDLLGLGLAPAAFQLGSDLRPGALRTPRASRPGRQAALAQLGRGEELGVAAEQDVGAAAGHVGGDGDRALAAGLRDDLGLAGVVLRVEHLVRDAAPAQQLARGSRTSPPRPCRPGPAGRPACRSAMSSTTASNLAFSVL